MSVLHWCMMGVTLLLLLCEVVISQVCESLITLLDGFHTLYLLMQMSSFSLQSSSVKLSSLGFPASSPPAPSSSAPPHSSESLLKPPQSPPQPSRAPPAPPLDCGLNYANSRIRPLGALISALVLACLNISCLIEIINFMLEPRPGQEPLLVVVAGAVSLLFKMLVLGLSCIRLQGDRVHTEEMKDTESHIEVNHRVLAEGESKGLVERGGVLDSIGEVEPAVDDSLHNGALVLRNPDFLKLPDSDSPAPMQQDGEASTGAPDLKICTCEAHLGDITEIHKDSTCIDDQNSSKPPPAYTSSHQSKSPIPNSQQSACLIPFTLNIQDLLTPILVLINSLVMLTIGPMCSGPCSVLVYMDPVLSVLAVILLTVKALPEVLRYGMLLLQSTPPHISVSDLGRRIADVPGVQAVHDLHIWQLTDSSIVASVHIHCHAGFPVYRCADVLLGVTRVLQSVGVNCCTVQPEFTSCSAPSAAGQADSATESPSTTPLPTCSLTCGKACAGNMCCAVLEDGCRGLSAPPAGETKKDRQTLILENNFH
ncbi:zinc/cadmium resistance protein [Sphaeramia orbicularis]|uniref:zinc/cadmium resistance protein n=1 Tax=Sphaeramia orbicularis TaxID=375764 RepID=UPI00117F46DD|nr:zinc/cadmium resistance protein-like [Sphaeramia orbicularis]